MATGSVSALDQDNWQLITSTSPSAQTSFTLASGISGYKKLMLSFSFEQSVDNVPAKMQFNSDTNANNYGVTAVMYYVYAQWQSSNGAYVPLHGYQSEGAIRTVGYITIDNANKDIPKVINGGGGKASVINGVYLGNAITSIVISMASGNLTGSFNLYGIAG